MVRCLWRRAIFVLPCAVKLSAEFWCPAARKAQRVDPHGMAALQRIVKMVFREEEIPTFEAVFAAAAPHIRAFPGCEHLALWQDQDNPSTFFTYSHWSGPEALEAYRHSALFRTTWAKTKILFAAKPQAGSVETRVVLS